MTWSPARRRRHVRPEPVELIVRAGAEEGIEAAASRSSRRSVTSAHGRKTFRKTMRLKILCVFFGRPRRPLPSGTTRRGVRAATRRRPDNSRPAACASCADLARGVWRRVRCGKQACLTTEFDRGANGGLIALPRAAERDYFHALRDSDDTTLTGGDERPFVAVLYSWDENRQRTVPVEATCARRKAVEMSAHCRIPVISSAGPFRRSGLTS